MKIDYTEIAADGDKWEQFAREFLEELGFTIEEPPARGPDGGKDLLVTESTKGRLGTYPMRWLVSCKNFAVSKRAVGIDDETSIGDRLDAFRADGFIGFYSTLISSGLNDRLSRMRHKKKILDYYVLDGEIIEGHLIRTGYSTLMSRYFPKSYKEIAPLRRVLSEYIPLVCDNCGKDLLPELDTLEPSFMIGFVNAYNDISERKIVKVYCACKGDCDRLAEYKYVNSYKIEYGTAWTGWEDISSIAIPPMFIRWVLTVMNRLHGNSESFSKEAYEELKDFIICLSQKVLRETTEREFEKFAREVSLKDSLLP